jgi:hypothetical protein
MPPHLGFFSTYTAPAIPTIEANMALIPSPVISEAKIPNSTANIPPSSPNIPPYIPKTNSTVLEGVSTFSISLFSSI